MVITKTTNLTAQDLAQLDLFQGENATALAWIAPKCRVEHYAADSILLDPDSSDDQAYLILQGEVQVRIGNDPEQIIATLGEGQCVGEMSVIEDEAPSAYVVTETPCQVLAIDGAALRTLLKDSNVVALNLLRMLARRLRKDNLTLRKSLEQQAASALHARIDPLTGLYNRRWLDETLSTLIEHHRSRGGQLTLLMLDLDHFKRFNDTHGHLAGDHALITVASLLKQHIRVGDQAARFGGEEFLVLLPDTDSSVAKQIASRLRHAVRGAAILDHKGRPLPRITVSIGLAEWCAEESARSLLDRADAALYRAKREGRDRIASSQPNDLELRATAKLQALTEHNLNASVAD